MGHIEDVCKKSRQCIDTLVLYLNGPTLKANGDLLLWDHNADGIYSETETIKLVDLLAPLRRCGAKNYLVIADQNYAGRIITEVERGRALGYRNFNKIHVVTASSERSYTWKRSFTKNFIHHDNILFDRRVNETGPTRRIKDIFKVDSSLLSVHSVFFYVRCICTDLSYSNRQMFELREVRMIRVNLV